MPRHRNVPLHGGMYRWVNNLDTPWEASPVIPDNPNAFDGFPWNPTSVRRRRQWSEKSSMGGPKTKSKKPDVDHSGVVCKT